MIQKYIHPGILTLLAMTFLVSCKQDPKPSPISTKERVVVPAFNSDSAYAHIVNQLNFGFRVPGTKEHEACKDYLVNEFNKQNLKTRVQRFKAEIYTGEEKTGYNIIAQYKPELKRRVVLGAHWDSRFIADKDENPENHDKPILGADDGASGVAAILEIARLINENPIDLGVDFILFDLEDQGDMGGDNLSWALGSQYWAKNLVPKNYTADFGILLDMIASKEARFGKEAYSARYAPQILDKVWKLAQNMGYSDLFQDYNAGAIADDHVYMNQAGIPTIDIISIPRPGNTESSFGTYHHTVHDDLDIISKRNLRVVGQIVTAVLYRYSDGSF